MMNVLALALLAFSLAGAGVWSPPPAKTAATTSEPVPVREGHRLIIVEYERESSQPPSHPSPLDKLSAAVDKAKDKAAELLPGPSEKHTPKEVISDLFSSSKEKVAKAEEKIKEKAEELKKNVTAKAAEKTEEFKKNVTEKTEELKNYVTGIAAWAGRQIAELAERVADMAHAAEAGVPVADLAAVAHMAAFAMAYGTGIWVTFVSSQVLAGAVSRHQFGVLQSKLYPVYFRAMAYAVGLAAVTAARASSRYLLLSSLALVLINLFLLEPKATKVMFKKMKMEKEEGRGRDMSDVTTETTTASMAPGEFGVARTTTTTTRTTEETVTNMEALKKLDTRLRRLNTYSSYINVLSLMALSWHLVSLARCLQGSCEPDGPR